MNQIDIAGDLRSWKTYEYIGPDHFYHDVRYQADGGPGGGPHIWADDSMWSIDVPAQPQAILPFIRYQYWLSEPPADLRNATVRLALRGDGLNLHGSQCFFWIVTYAPASRLWHYTHQPIAISEGGWAEAVSFPLVSTPERWQCGTAGGQAQAGRIDGALGACFSYGLSLVGFSRKVTGRLSLGSFELLAHEDPCWPFVFNQRRSDAAWLTLSRSQNRQLSISPAAGAALRLHEDFTLIREIVPFSYLAYLQAGPATGRRDLRNAVVMVQHNADWLDCKGGKVGFFIEHAASSTRWVLRMPIEVAAGQPWYQILPTDENLWFRLSGTLPLAELLGGQVGGAKYDYLGLMIVGSREEPSGSWELRQFSVGPTVDMGA